MKRTGMILGFTAMIGVGGLWIITERIAALYGYSASLGTALWVFETGKLYRPWQGVGWMVRDGWRHGEVWQAIYPVVVGTFGLMAGCGVLFRRAHTRQSVERGTHGSARWATLEEMRQRGVL